MLIGKFTFSVSYDQNTSGKNFRFGFSLLQVMAVCGHSYMFIIIIIIIITSDSVRLLTL